jgi:transposase
VAEASAGLWRAVVSAEVVHSDLGRGAAAGAGHRAAAAPGRDRDRVEQSAVSDVAAEYGVSWPTAHKALVAAAVRWLPEPAPTSRLGIDETRFRSVRWILDGVAWIRSDPWLTSFVDCRDGSGSLLGLAQGCRRLRPGLAREQSDAFRQWIEIAVIDPSAPYACGIRAALPNVKIAVGGWQLVAMAKPDGDRGAAAGHPRPAGLPGTVADPVWVNRRLLLTGADHLSAKQWRRLGAMLDANDPTGEIGAAWG